VPFFAVTYALVLYSGTCTERHFNPENQNHRGIAMLRATRFVGIFAAAASLTFALSGCKKSVNTVPVSGKVTLDGNPITSGQVTFTPTDDGGSKELSAGTIGSDGSYTIKTGGKEGAPPGKYKASITPAMAANSKSDGKPDIPYPIIYTTPNKTPLTIEVVASPAAGAYDLKLVSEGKK
jgi:hypothetical protein